MFDKFVLALTQELKNPTRMIECLHSILLELTLTSPKLSSRKNFEFVNSLIAIIAKENNFVSLETLKTLRSNIKDKYRGNFEVRASDFDFTVRDIEFGELSVKRFLAAKAWKGLPGFGEEFESQSVKEWDESRPLTDIDGFDAGKTKIGKIVGTPWDELWVKPNPKKDSKESNEVQQ